ncbi:MAG TPA: hypothetical protein VJJ21_01110 [Candidatus Nanoarchaeia archaeon]|nr:hypothetical protein [Candidatus Nanoarchaeia archaeon]
MKVNFRYSTPYDEMLSIMSGEELSHSQTMIAKGYLGKINEYWGKEGAKIAKEIEKVSGLKFNKDIEGFVVSEMAFEAISHPFTIKMCDDFNRLRGILVHELLHVLMVQNEVKVLNMVNRLQGDSNFKVHFPVLLCERRVLENLYGNFKVEKRVEDLDEVWKEVNRVYPGFKKSGRKGIEFMREYAAGRKV